MFGIDDIVGVGMKLVDKLIPDPAQKAQVQLLEHMKAVDPATFRATNMQEVLNKLKENENKIAGENQTAQKAILDAKNDLAILEIEHAKTESENAKKRTEDGKKQVKEVKDKKKLAKGGYVNQGVGASMKPHNMFSKKGKK